MPTLGQQLTNLKSSLHALQGESSTVVGEGDEAAVVAYETWEPDVLPSSGTLYEDPAEATQNSDILSTLISIYGTKELFINEYR